MATINGSVSNRSDLYTYRLITEEILPSDYVSTNKSKLKVTVQIVTGGSSGTTYASRSASATHTVTINGTNYSFTTGSYSLVGGSTITLGSVTSGDITHNNDGTKTVAVSASSPDLAQGGGWGPYSGSASGNVTLTTIPRASSFTTSGNTIGSAVSVSITRASSSFTHTVTLKFSNITETKTNIGTSTSFTPDLATYAAKIPNATSGTGTITVDTYNGNTKIGTSTQNITLNLPASVKPTAPTITLAEAVSGIASKFGAYIQSKSKINVSASASGSYGSTISSYKIEINGSTYNSSSAQTGFLTTSGSNTCKVTVTDSRGRTNTTSTTFNVLAYTSPQITLFTAQRNATTETTINCVMSGSITNLNNKNDKSFKVTTSVSSGDKYSKTDVYSISNATCNITGATTTNVYTVTFTVSDYFTTVSQTINIGTGSALMNFAPDGDKMAIGQVYDTNNSSTLQVKTDVAISNSGYFGILKPTTLGADRTYTLPNKNGTVAMTSDTVTGATNATNTNITNTKPESATTYYPTFVSGTSGNNAHRVNDGIRYNTLEGTADATGRGWLYLGNGTASGTAGNKQGRLRLYSSNTGYAELYYTNTTANASCILPSNASGYTLETKPKNLYNNTTGTTGTITLSETSANFTFLKIYYYKEESGAGGKVYHETTVYLPNGKLATLFSTHYANATNHQMISKIVQISGTSVTHKYGMLTNITTSKTIGACEIQNSIYIVRIDGYKG